MAFRHYISNKAFKTQTQPTTLYGALRLNTEHWPTAQQPLIPALGTGLTYF